MPNKRGAASTPAVAASLSSLQPDTIPHVTQFFEAIRRVSNCLAHRLIIYPHHERRWSNRPFTTSQLVICIHISPKRQSPTRSKAKDQGDGQSSSVGWFFLADSEQDQVNHATTTRSDGILIDEAVKDSIQAHDEPLYQRETRDGPKLKGTCQFLPVMHIRVLVPIPFSLYTRLKKRPYKL